jgi:hypothetical protein
MYHIRIIAAVREELQRRRTEMIAATLRPVSLFLPPSVVGLLGALGFLQGLRYQPFAISTSICRSNITICSRLCEFSLIPTDAKIPGRQKNAGARLPQAT